MVVLGGKTDQGEEGGRGREGPVRSSHSCPAVGTLCTETEFLQNSVYCFVSIWFLTNLRLLGGLPRRKMGSYLSVWPRTAAAGRAPGSGLNTAALLNINWFSTTCPAFPDFLLVLLLYIIFAAKRKFLCPYYLLVYISICLHYYLKHSGMIFHVTQRRKI